MIAAEFDGYVAQLESPPALLVELGRRLAGELDDPGEKGLSASLVSEFVKLVRGLGVYERSEGSESDRLLSVVRDAS